MSEQFEFEDRFAAAMRAYARGADQPFDPVAIAGAAIAVAPRRQSWRSGIRVLAGRTRVAWLVLAFIVLLAAFASAAIVFAPSLPEPDAFRVPNGIVFERDGAIWSAETVGGSAVQVARGVRGPLVSPDGSRIAAVNSRNELVILDRDGIVLATLAPPSADDAAEALVSRVAWAPNGVRLAIWIRAQDPSTYAPDVLALIQPDGTLLSTTPVPFQYSDDPTLTWSPDGRWIAMSGSSTGARRLPFSIWLLATDGSGFRELDAAHDVWLPRWSPDGRTVAVAGSTGLTTLDIDTQDMQVISNLDGNWVPSGVWPTNLAWSPDGQTIAVMTETALWTVRPDGTALRQVWSGPVGMSGSNQLEWEADSRHVLVVTLDSDRVPDGLVEIDTATGQSRTIGDPVDSFDLGVAPNP